jgi:glycosyltransferase involved in cell wall biosynthesis
MNWLNAMWIRRLRALRYMYELVVRSRSHAERDTGLDAATPLAMGLPSASRTRPRDSAKDVAVIGYLRTTSGVGEAGRQTLRTLLAGGVATEGCDVALNVTAARDDQSCAELLVETSTAPVQIFNVNGDQLPLVVKHLAPRLRPDSIRIGIPFWELSHYPDAWLPGLAAMDEIWAPSRFIAQSLRGRLGEKVIYMPVALELTSPVAPMSRARFDLPQTRFLFFFAFDFLSFIERKNPGAAIAAFREAFPRRGQAGLVLKCINGALVPDKLARLREDFADDPDIFLIDDTLTRADTLALIASMDAVISLHRSEGLGLLIGEAMLLGRPVIATDYSASRDLLSSATGYPVKFKLVPVREGEYPFATGQVWAEPDLSHAAILMRELCSDPARAAPLVQRAQERMRAQFSYKNVGRLQAGRLLDLTPRASTSPRPARLALPA